MKKLLTEITEYQYPFVAGDVVALKDVTCITFRIILPQQKFSVSDIIITGPEAEDHCVELNYIDIKTRKLYSICVPSGLLIKVKYE